MPAVDPKVIENYTPIQPYKIMTFKEKIKVINFIY